MGPWVPLIRRSFTSFDLDRSGEVWRAPEGAIRCGKIMENLLKWCKAYSIYPSFLNKIALLQWYQDVLRTKTPKFSAFFDEFDHLSSWAIPFPWPVQCWADINMHLCIEMHTVSFDLGCRIRYGIIYCQSSLPSWWFGTFFIFPYIGNFIIPPDFHIFQRGWLKPPTSYMSKRWTRRSSRMSCERPRMQNRCEGRQGERLRG
jgi:hypothetical protein